MINLRKAIHYHAFAILAMQLIAPSTAQNFREQDPCFPINPNMTYTCPVNRYCDWMTLNVPNRNIYKNTARYTRRSWDYQGRKNEIEDSKFEDLSTVVQDTLALAGFDAESHLCCHGHYLPLNWTELSMDVYAGPKAAFELLGYDETNWGVDGTSLPFDGVAWDDLPEEIQSALSLELCYNKELWDGVDLSQWTNETVIPGSFPTMMFEGMSITESLMNATETESLMNVTESEDVFMNVTNETLSPTGAPTVISTVPPATESPTESPTGSPTVTPTVTPTGAPTGTPTGAPTGSPTGAPTGAPTVLPTTAATVPETAEVISASSRPGLAFFSSAFTFTYVLASLM